MKKFIIAFLLLPCLAYAQDAKTVNTLSVSDIKTLETLDTADVKTFGGITITATSDCPSYYASAIISMDFENGLNACDSSGNDVLFTDSGSDIGAYGEGGGQGMKVDDSGEYIYLSQTDSQYVNEDADQTFCARMCVSAQLTNNARVAHFTDDDAVGADEDEIEVFLSNHSPPRVFGNYNAEGGTAQATADGLAGYCSSYYTIAYSWEGADAGSNGDHAPDAGDGDGYDADVDELDWAMTDYIDLLRIGSETIDPGATQYYYLDAWAVVSGYQATCPSF